MNVDKANQVIAELLDRADGTELVVAGSVRRGKKDGIKDIDVIVVDYKIPKLLDDQEGGEKIQSGTLMGEKVDFALCQDRSQLGAMLFFFTGSKDFNIRMRALAKRKGYKLNRYGLWLGEELIESRTEQNIMSILGLKYVHPERR